MTTNLPAGRSTPGDLASATYPRRQFESYQRLIVDRSGPSPRSHHRSDAGSTDEQQVGDEELTFGDWNREVASDREP